MEAGTGRGRRKEVRPGAGSGQAQHHAHRTIGVGATVTDGMATIVIDDDGPGLSDAALHAALVPGLRLDEAGEGYGFGLSIVRELAELNGGTVTLARSRRTGWGLAVALALPCAVGA